MTRSPRDDLFIDSWLGDRFCRLLKIDWRDFLAEDAEQLIEAWRNTDPGAKKSGENLWA